MSLSEATALPFALNLPAVSAWLSGLPIGNVRLRCQAFFPVVQHFNQVEVPSRLRLEILNVMRPLVQGTVRDLLPYFLEKSFPLEGKNRKIASLCVRLHLEFARGHRQLLEAEDFNEQLSAEEQETVLRQGYEHAARAFLHAAQMFEAPPKALWTEFQRLQAVLATPRWLAAASSGRESALAAARRYGRAIQLFRLAAPNRLTQGEMQQLMIALCTPAGAEPGAGAETGHGADFCFNPLNARQVKTHFAAWTAEASWEKMAVGDLLVNLRRQHHGGPSCLGIVLPRLGGRLPCPEKPALRTANLAVGFDAIDNALRDLEARRRSGDTGSPWSGKNHLDLAPMDYAGPDGAGRVELLAGEKSTVQIQVTDIPGYYLLDLVHRSFAVGQIISLNSDDQWIQIGVVRAGQIRDGRYWYGVEALGMSPRRMRARLEGDGTATQPGLVLEDAAAGGSGLRLLVSQSKWRSGDVLRLGENGPPYRIAKLYEETASFCEFGLIAGTGND